MRHLALTALAAALLACAATDAGAHAKTDIIRLNNGDKITCEIKELSRGKLKVKTDAAGTIYIEWADITAVESIYYFRIQTSDGDRYYGSPEMDSTSTKLRVVSDTMIVSMEAETVIEITPLEASFWSKNEGSVSLGFNFTKASDVGQLMFDWSNRFRKEKDLVDSDIYATLTQRGDVDSLIQREGVELSYVRLLKRKLTASLSASMERNDELGLRRRFLGGAAFGTSPVITNSNLLLVSLGLAVNNELAFGSDDWTQSLEASISGDYQLFVYDTPKRDINIDLAVFPSITDGGRVRTNLDIKFSWEIISDLMFQLSYWLNYDNRGADGEGATRDYGITTSIGYTY